MDAPPTTPVMQPVNASASVSRECFGWAKTIGGLRKSHFVGREKLDFRFVLTMTAYNLVRMRNLGVVAC